MENSTLRVTQCGLTSPAAEKTVRESASGSGWGGDSLEQQSANSAPRAKSSPPHVWYILKLRTIFIFFDDSVSTSVTSSSLTLGPRSLKYSLAGSSPHPHLHLGVWLIFSWNVCALQSNTSSNFQKVVPFLKTNNGDISYGLGEHICKETYSLVLLGRVDHFHLFLCNNLELHIKKASLMQTYLPSNSTLQNLF